MGIGLLVFTCMITLPLSIAYIIYQYEWLRQLGEYLMYIWFGIGGMAIYIIASIIFYNKDIQMGGVK